MAIAAVGVIITIIGASEDANYWRNVSIIDTPKHGLRIWHCRRIRD
jgi:hypothetical protein